ncbi:MAG: hypothetical protein R3E65_10250 [Steroidobacteraceae bacterium]
MNFGAAARMPRPIARAALARAARQVQPKVIKLDDAGDEPIDADGHQRRDRDEHRQLRHERLVADRAERDHDDLGRQDAVGAIALDLVFLQRHQIDGLVGDGGDVLRVLRRRLGLVEQLLGDLFESLVAQERAADHQQRRHRPGRKRTDRERRRHEDQLVDDRPLGDPPDNRQFPIRPHAGDLLRVQREVIAEYTSRLLRRDLGQGGDVVEHRRDVIDQRKQTATSQSTDSRSDAARQP